MSDAPRLIVLDLDGTLLGADGAVSERNSAALHRAVRSGARVVIATGRPPRWLEHIRPAVPSSLALCCNGGLVLDLDTDAVIASYPLDGAAIVRAVGELRAAGSVFSVAGEGLPDFGIAAEFDFPRRGSAGVVRMAIDDICAVHIVKILIRPEPGTGQAVVDYFATRFGREFTLTSSTNDGLIEISRFGITKGSVIAGIAAGWGIDPACAVAFGDMPNDIEMLRWAGHSVAMGNADGTVKAIATETAGHHDRSAVAEILERWF